MDGAIKWMTSAAIIFLCLWVNRRLSYQKEFVILSSIKEVTWKREFNLCNDEFDVIGLIWPKVKTSGSKTRRPLPSKSPRRSSLRGIKHSRFPSFCPCACLDLKTTADLMRFF